MDKQKILIVHNYYQIPGGEDTVVANEKLMLEEHGHKVIFYSRSNSELKTMSWLKKMLIPLNTIFNFRTYKEVKTIIKKHQIDIVHVHNTLNLISPAIYYAAKACNVPLVQTIHNFRMICPGAILYRNGHICEECLEKGLLCAVKHKCYHGSVIQTLACVINIKLHCITGIYGNINYICLTEFNKNKLVTLKNIKEKKVFVKPNFIDGINKLIPAAQREDYFIFVGRLDKYKGIDIMMKAWKQMGKKVSKLLICGTGSMDEWCKKFVMQNNVNIEMLGFVSNEKVQKLIATSKALIFPTQCYEGFPLSIIEAFSVGTPVICSDIGNAGDMVIEGITGIKFKYDSVEALIKAVKQLEMHKSIYDTTLIEYRKKYTENQNYNLLMQIYCSIQI